LHFCGGDLGLWGGLTLKKLTKTQLIYSVSCFNLGGLRDSFGGAKPPKTPVATGLTQLQQQCFLSIPFHADVCLPWDK